MVCAPRSGEYPGRFKHLQSGHPTRAPSASSCSRADPVQALHTFFARQPRSKGKVRRKKPKV